MRVLIFFLIMAVIGIIAGTFLPFEAVCLLLLVAFTVLFLKLINWIDKKAERFRGWIDNKVNG